MAKKTALWDRPTAEQLEGELSRIEGEEKKKVKKRIVLVPVISAVAVLIIALFCLFPVSAADGHILVLSRLSSPSPGDMTVISYGNHNICRYVIAESGDTVDIDAAGVIYINEQPSQEKYIKKNRDSGVDIDLPCTVAENEFFVVSESENGFPDSRDTKLGCVKEEIILGKVIFKLK